MKIFWLTILSISLSLAGTVGAQGPPNNRRGPQAGSRTQGSRTQGSRTQGSRTQGSRTQGSRTQGSRAGGLNGSFEQSAPKVGELLPDVSALDADGKPLELRSLKGHYSVLVFGCLT